MAETKITLTNAELATKRNAAQHYINSFPDRTRLHHALEKFLKRTKTDFEKFQDAENDLRVDAALIEETEKKVKRFVYETVPSDRPGVPPQKVLAVDPEKAKELQKKLRVLEREEVSFEPAYCQLSDLPDDMEARWQQVFIGLVVKEDPLDAKTEPAAEMAVN